MTQAVFSSAAPSETALIPTPSGTHTATIQPAKRIEVPPSELRGTIIHFWHVWSGSAGEVMQSLIEDFNLHNEWGIMVVPVLQTTLDEMSANVKATLTTAESPDLVMGYPHQYLEWDEIKGLVDLYPYVNDPTWGFSLDEQADFYPTVWDQDVLDGKRLGIPAQRSAQVLYYNETWAKSLGFAGPPITPEQFMEQACSAARLSRQDEDPANDGTGGWMVSTNYAAMLGWIYSFGGEIIRSPEPGLGQTVYEFNTPQVEETFTFLRGLYDQLCAWLPEKGYPEEEFASRQGLFVIGSVMDIPFQADALSQAGNQDQWTVIPFPSPSARSAIDVYGPSFVVLPSTPQRQLATWLLIKWLVSSSNYALLVGETSALPLRASTLSYLSTFQSRYPQWTEAVKLLPLGRSEPSFRSWENVRWALSDASMQLFRDYFTIDQVPVLIDYLDYTVAELHLGLESGSISSLTPTITPKITLVSSLTFLEDTPRFSPTPSR